MPASRRNPSRRDVRVAAPTVVTSRARDIRWPPNQIIAALPDASSRGAGFMKTMWFPEPTLQPADFPHQCATLFRQLPRGSAFPPPSLPGLTGLDPAIHQVK